MNAPGGDGRSAAKRASGPSGGGGADATDDGGIGIPREVLRQVRRIELRTRGIVDSLFGGEYEAVFKGQGVEFAEVREYRPGDDIRTIDWNVTARMARPYVKKHVEERELTLLLLVDVSGSEQFGTRGRFKAELAAELAAVLALAAIRNNDRVGLLLFTDRVEHVVPPGKGRRHVLRLIRDLLVFEPRGRGTDLAGAVEYASRLLNQRSIVCLLSDFIAPVGDELGEEAPQRVWDAWERALGTVARRHDVIALELADAAERELPDVGLLALRDPETGERTVVDTSRASLRRGYAAAARAERERGLRLFRRLEVDAIRIRTDRSYVAPLRAFFRRRERRLGR